MIYLKKVNLDDAEKEYLFICDVPYDENGFINDFHGISHDEFVSSAVKQMIDSADGIGLPEGYVPETFYFLWDNDEIVGLFRFRHFLCESLRLGAGHLGYFIKKEFRGKGYGKEGLRQILQIIKHLVPEDEIYLRVNKDNPASLKIMLHNGGYIEHEDEYKYYVRIRKSDL